MNATFNMRDLSNAIADKFNVTNQSGADIAEFVFNKIKQEVIDGRQVRLHQFGTIEARARKAGVARNPVSGERVEVPARRVVKLTVSPSFRLLVSQGEPVLAAVPAKASKGDAKAKASA
jgi:nucleoid DNA-binding protein